MVFCFVFVDFGNFMLFWFLINAIIITFIYVIISIILLKILSHYYNCYSYHCYFGCCKMYWLPGKKCFACQGTGVTAGSKLSMLIVNTFSYYYMFIARLTFKRPSYNYDYAYFETISHANHSYKIDSANEVERFLYLFLEL